MKRLLLAMLLAIVAPIATQARDGHAVARPAPAWQPWPHRVFEQAKRERKFVLLDLEAVWCHWCHVMDEKTYADPKVRALLRRHYLTVKVDSDAHPELARRYEDYGWPATIVFSAGGEEIVKRRGYLRPELMVSMLEHIVRDPSPVRYADSAPVTARAASHRSQHLCARERLADPVAGRAARGDRRGALPRRCDHRGALDRRASRIAGRRLQARPDDRGGPWLEDTLSMGRAFLAVYQASADRAWLQRAIGAAAFIDARFRSAAQPGFVTASTPAAAVLKPKAVVGREHRRRALC